MFDKLKTTTLANLFARSLQKAALYLNPKIALTMRKLGPVDVHFRRMTVAAMAMKAL